MILAIMYRRERILPSSNLQPYLQGQGDLASGLRLDAYPLMRKIVGMQKPRPHGSPFCKIRDLWGHNMAYKSYTSAY